ncbi:ATP-dependent zinc metalloprotease FtsH [Gleimia sp. 6138-11-ORH1]|uniref:ATP-dependent zinc metalloprotease FtsH n=1 Tax=Gleimia sp. 6138-11-ORH1 TaxID=2973937 RepID=UPI00216777F2|nr:ATP-dependent zinc metalloprotease FtsH [Gleimia sp. 6138-11-ORH1]MCS4484672.1 ATP-dependent zinc metalloprotease FtsH [Gleimia sp. 6138-11-ORH1]
MGILLIPLALFSITLWALWALFQPSVIKTSEALELLKGDTVQAVSVNDTTRFATLKLDKAYVHKPTHPEDREVNHGTFVAFTFSQDQGPDVLKIISDKKLKQGYDVSNPQPSFLMNLFTLMLPMFILVGIFYFFMTRFNGVGGGMLGGKKKRDFNKERPNVRFTDVAGADEAVEELEEIKNFLANAERYQKVGAKVPRGVLLYGPPGTGKTLLAKAVAGEAEVPFFSVSGSEFMELYVGMGASRVRDLFDMAKKAAPAIIFIDEIDAVGRHRGSGYGGGSDERDQTLNQMLVEMDGFDATTNLLVIAATNRPDVLDSALLRPGRFDRQIPVDAPDMKGREAILRVHAQGKPLTSDVDLQLIAKRTPGFTGADLANVLNEAALLTARSHADLIDMRAIDEAIDRVLAGPQKRTRVMNEHDRAVTAYHEAGHAICAAASRYSAPVTKVTILPRGRALGYTMVMPTEDRYSKTRNQLLDDLVYGLGGRVAEELVFQDPSTGASNDIEKVTSTAYALVADYGMSSSLGLAKLGKADSNPFGPAGGSRETHPMSPETAAAVDKEVRVLLDNAMREAWEILSRNRKVLDTLAQRLLDEETLLEHDLAEIFTALVKQPERPVWNYQADAAVEGAFFGELPKAETDSLTEQAENPITEVPHEADPNQAGEGH